MEKIVHKVSKLILAVPYVFVLIFMPVYSILDRLVFVEVFGCGCVPDVQENMFEVYSICYCDIAYVCIGSKIIRECSK